MFIKKISISNFGKISDLNLSFTKGLNIIYAPNESGKSTLLSFVKYMFYGTKQKKTHGDLSFKERHMPWNGTPMSGSVEIENDIGHYTIQRTDSERIGKLTVTDMINGETLPEITVPGMEFIGFGEKAFSDSCFISDVKKLNDAKSDGELITFFSLDGVTETTYNNVRDIICEKLAQLSSTKRKTSKLTMAQTKLENSIAKLQDVNSTIKDLESKLTELQYNEQELEKLVKENNELRVKKKRNTICRLNKEKEELLLKRSKIENETESFNKDGCISVPQEDKDILCDDFFEFSEKIKQNSLSRICNILLLFFFAVSLFVLGWFSYRSMYFFASAIALGVLTIRQGYIVYKKSKSLAVLSSELADRKFKKQSTMKKYGLINQTDCLLFLTNLNNRDIFESKRDFAIEQIKYIDNRLSEIKQIVDEDYNLLQTTGTDIKNFTNEDIDDIINDNEKRISSLTLSVNRNLHYKDELSERKNEANAVSEEIRLLEDEIQRLNEKIDVLNTALVILENSYAKTKGSFFPDLSKKTYEFFSRITGDSYNSLVTDDEFNISVNKNGYMRSAKYLSAGTFDILYFSLRLAIIHAMAQKGVYVPVFVDDVFSGCDDNRIYKIMDLLYELSKYNQIFLCTPRGREGDYFKHKTDVNIINL